MKILRPLLTALFAITVVLGGLPATSATAIEGPPYPTRPVIYLTFDDGPGIYTNEILEILGKDRAKATFFVTGEHISKRRSTYLRIVNKGHGVANHTWGHRNLTTLSKTLVQRELVSTQRQMAPHQNRCFRPPFLATNGRVKQWAKDIGLMQVMVNKSSGAANETDWRRIYNRVVNTAADGDVVLMHAENGGSHGSVEALRRIVPALKSKGFRMVALPQCQ